MSKPVLWLFISDIACPEIHLVIPAVAWMAEQSNARFECYLEAERDGSLFARTGSTVLGGSHHQQFNYLNAIFEVKYILYGDTSLFNSSIAAFGAEVLAACSTPAELYAKLLAVSGTRPGEVMFACGAVVQCGDKALELGPYVYPDIFFRRAWAFPASEGMGEQIVQLMEACELQSVSCLYLNEQERAQIRSIFPQAVEVDEIRKEDTYGTATVRIAERWVTEAKALAFGDPAAIVSQLPSLCRERRISIYGERVKLSHLEVQVNAYTEEKSEIADEVIRLAEKIGNRVIVGRQTCDGDLFHWAKGGVCIQIMDPNRPAFPIVQTIRHHWNGQQRSLFDEEPDDAVLERYADEGKLLATLVWHSGEMAHNEAMLNLFELAGFTGLKMGIGVHAARYETCPQLWELMSIPREKGGVLGLIEPVLHTGGMGIMAEVNCPPRLLEEHCRTALGRIRQLAGDEAAPRGYYAFMDTQLGTLERPKTDALYEAAESAGLEYFISSALPGRNLIFRETERSIAINLTPRSVCSGSPFVRITTVEECHEGLRMSPGWFIGVLDAPVISFNPYIWRHGSRFMSIVDWMTSGGPIVNATPRTIARYARLLYKRGLVPLKPNPTIVDKN